MTGDRFDEARLIELWTVPAAVVGAQGIWIICSIALIGSSVRITIWRTIVDGGPQGS